MLKNDLDMFSLKLATQYKAGKTKMGVLALKFSVWPVLIIFSLCWPSAPVKTRTEQLLFHPLRFGITPPTSRGLDERRRDHGHHHGQVPMFLAAGHGGGRRAGGFRDAVPRRCQRRRAADSVRGTIVVLGRRRDFWQQVFWK